MLNNVFKKNMAWLESEQAAAPHGYYRQAPGAGFKGEPG